MRISTKLSIATLAIIILTTLGTFFVFRTSHTFEKLNQQSNLQLKVISSLTEFRLALRQMIVATYQSLYQSAGKDRLNYNEAVETATAKLLNIDLIENEFAQASKEKSKIDTTSIKSGFDQLTTRLNQILDLQLAGKSEKAHIEMENTVEVLFKSKILKEIARVLEKERAKEKIIQQSFNKAADGLSYIAPLGLLIIFLLSIGVFTPLTFSLTRKVQILMRYLHEFDFENNKFPSIPAMGHDEFSSIGVRFNELFANLKQSKSQVDKQQRELLISSRMASLGEMSAGVAHEINNPLAVIVGNIHLLQKNFANPEKFASKVELIDKSCNRIIKIVNGLKKFSRSGMQSSFERKSVSSIIKESLVLTEGKSKRHMTPVEFEQINDVVIDCDEIEIEQVLVNLINNAIDAVKDNADRWVKITIDVNTNLEGVVKIIDSGNGIPFKIQEKIFDPFFTTKSVGQGTGLGLSITKGILEGHKANIVIDSDHKNTCFEIKFYEIKNASIGHSRPIDLI